MAVRPSDDGIVYLLEEAISDLLDLKMYTQIASSDISRAISIKVGLEQQAPTYVTILIHQNDPADPKSWPHDTHSPLRSGSVRTTQASRSSPRVTIGREFVGSATPDEDGFYGGTLYERAFTLEFRIMLKKRIGSLTLTERDVGRVAETVTGRAAYAMREGNYHVGTDQSIEDDYGEATVAGPFFGKSWADLEEGKSYRAIGYLQLWYLTQRA